jgi:hypothetical protein
MHKKRLMRSMHSVLCMMFLTIFFCSTTWAQTLTIRLINAKSGKAMRNQSVTFHWGEGSASSSVTVDHDGAAHVEVPVGATQFYMSPGPRQGKEPYRIAYLDCNGSNAMPISISDVVANGVIPKNLCSQRSTSGHSGEVVFWALPRPLIDMQ